MKSSAAVRADNDRMRRLIDEREAAEGELSAAENDVTKAQENYKRRYQKIVEIDRTISSVIATEEPLGHDEEVSVQVATPVRAKRKYTKKTAQVATPVLPASVDGRPALDWRWVRNLFLERGPLQTGDITTATVGPDGRRLVSFANEHQKGINGAVSFALEPILRDAETNGYLVLRGDLKRYELTEKGRTEP